MMIYGSVCSGIEAATVAWRPLGWKPAWFSEVDKFCCSMLAHHYPGVQNLGDITQITEEMLNEHKTIDLLVGGTPCQSFSQAGLRNGLDDARGNLAFEFLRIAKSTLPKWVVWENVPSVLSSNGGRDFGTILWTLEKLGYGIAYRVLDAQYGRSYTHPNAVPQRRKRVFVIGYLGDWRPPAAVLFEQESLYWHPPPSRKTGTEVAPTVSSSVRNGDSDFIANGGVAYGGGNTKGPIDVSTCVHTKNRVDFDVETFVVEGITPPLRSRATYDNGDGDFLVPMNSYEGAPTIAMLDHSLVRRLTPIECERLMGLPDNYTLIPYRKKMAKDTPRYKALGNSMAVNCMNWIGHRIQMVNEIIHTTREKI